MDGLERVIEMWRARVEISSGPDLVAPALCRAASRILRNRYCLSVNALASTRPGMGKRILVVGKHSTENRA